jgi:DNA-binding MurR/RpiR family transcriptional regulator
LTEKDLLVAISFGRCLRETVEAVERGHARGVPTFGITDNDTSPIALHCDDYLVASTSSPSFTGSYVAPMALINTIIVACAHLRPKRALAMLSRTEQEYRTGTRWYQEPLRRSRASNGGQEKMSGNSKGSRKKAS